MKCGEVWWPILGICALHLTHPSAHTQQRVVNKHTHREHTPGAVGSHLCCGARGAVGGSVPCSRVSPQSWYWRWRERWLLTPPTYNSCRTWDSNPRPSGYKSDSQSIRSWLPPKYMILIMIYYLNYTVIQYYLSILPFFYYQNFIMALALVDRALIANTHAVVPAVDDQRLLVPLTDLLWLRIRIHVDGGSCAHICLNWTVCADLR